VACGNVSRALADEPASTVATPPASTVATPPASVDPRDTARTLANRAADAIAQGEHEQAEELLRQAYVQYPAPTIAVLHARTLVHLQRLSTAASVYERASLTTLGPEAPPAFRRAVEQAQTEVKALWPRVPRLQLVVRGQAARNPALRLTLDGRLLSVAQHGRWIWVDPGRRVVRAELDGAVSEQVVRVEERQSIVVDVSEPASERTFYRAVTWSSLGIGAAGIATGVVTGVIATSAYDRAAKSCPDDRCVEGSAGARELERFHKYRVVSTVGYAVGATGLALGGYLLIRSAVDGPALQLELEERSARLSYRGTL
jgi:hypothetical protein